MINTAVQHSGVGQHVEVVGMAAQTSFLKAFVGMEVCWVSIMGMAKLSILLFFWRIFSITSMKWCIYVLMSITGLWYLGSVSCLVEQRVYAKRLTRGPAYHRLRSMHTLFRTVGSHGRHMRPSRSCVSRHRRSAHRHRLCPHRGACSVHLAIEDAHAAKGRHLSDVCARQSVSAAKIGERYRMAQLMIAGLCSSIVASIIRLVITVAHIPPGPDITWNFVPFVQWSATELYTALGTANLPSLGPLVRGRWERKRAATPMRPLDDDASSLRGFKTPSASKSAVTDVRVVDSRDGHKGGFRVVEEEEGDEYAVTLREFASAA